MNNFTIVLQAGGKSTRMGTDKALLPFMKTTLLGYIVEQVTPLSDDLILITNTPESYQGFGLPTFSDVYRDWGALGGLHAAVHHARREVCLVLACDMPFVSRNFLRHLVEQIDGYDAVVPRLAATGFTEPFRAVYRKSCLPSIEQAIRNGQRRVNSFFDRVRVRYVDQPEIERFDPALWTFFNVNTPEDLVEARRIAQKHRSAG